jgi:hypothetical protein
LGRTVIDTGDQKDRLFLLKEFQSCVPGFLKNGFEEEIS